MFFFLMGFVGCGSSSDTDKKDSTSNGDFTTGGNTENKDGEQKDGTETDETGKDGATDGSGTTGKGDNNNNSSTETVWQEPGSSDGMTWDEAVKYCEDLDTQKFTDWRLPTIGELRTFVKGCDDTKEGGGCGVTGPSRLWSPKLTDIVLTVTTFLFILIPKTTAGRFSYPGEWIKRYLQRKSLAIT